MTEIDNIYVVITSVINAMEKENIYDKYTLIIIDHRVRLYVELISENDVKISRSDFYKIIKSLLNDMKNDFKFDKRTLEIFESKFKRNREFYERFYDFI